MLFFFFSFAIPIIFFLIIFISTKRHCKSKEIDTKEKNQINDVYSTHKEAINQFFADFDCLKTRYISKKGEMLFAEKWHWLYTELSRFNFFRYTDSFENIRRFKNTFKSFSDYVEEANESFVQNESIKYDALFSNIDGKNLDEQQRRAVITDEDRILVLAGAGSGKTLTIAAKVKYLTEVKSINPQEILLLSFTRKSAQEMTERIQNKLRINAEATTFHKLGLDIIKDANGQCPNVLDENELVKFVHNFFENELLSRPNLVKDLTEYFAYFLEIPDDMENYSSLGELYDDEKNADLETLKSKYDRERFISDKTLEKAKHHKTLNNESVKSLEETKIANYLFMNGINYEYERLYPFESEDLSKKNYRPDFYLVDYDIYLEHFGVSKDFTVPWLSPVEEKKYLDGIEWKRNFHKKNGTKLIETYSYYNSEGVLLERLEEVLLANGVELKHRDFVDIFNTVYVHKSDKYFSEFIKLCCTFVTLFKSNNYKIEKINDLKNKYFAEEKNFFMRERTALFLNIIETILSEYQKHLLINNAIDFSDMINDAAEKISTGYEIAPYKYVIVDEYQDISKSRFTLLKSIADKTGAKFFCVGDDWQSIYRFAGSDISLFTEFEKYFGYTKILKIEKTYRNSQQLIDEASKFILRNPMQLRKALRSDKFLDYPLVFWGYEKEPGKVLQQMINKIISEFGVNSSILLLGRTNYDCEIAKKSGLFKISYKNRKESFEYIPNPTLPINFMSVHKSKGLEADNVIILNFRNDTLGFPNQIADDSVLNLVLTNAENYVFAEERRLFYVAITRTRNRTFILTDCNNPSPFFKEFKESKSVCYVAMKETDAADDVNCPLCKTGRLLRIEHSDKTFVGCSNFPKCRYTLNDPKILLHPIKCPSCGGFLVRRYDKNHHAFLGCTNYPYCEYTDKIRKK